ncbi:hypothetical protein DTW90_29550 [Neorhizobium sp. P12A]|nr:hypothetical protein DTW90_29550 [Neorhizobium sp. P12A]
MRDHATNRVIEASLTSQGKRSATMATKDSMSMEKSAQKAGKPAAEKPKKEQDDLLEEALEETFPASDPMSSMHFTSSKDKKKS